MEARPCWLLPSAAQLRPTFIRSVAHSGTVSAAEELRPMLPPRGEKCRLISLGGRSQPDRVLGAGRAGSVLRGVFWEGGSPDSRVLRAGRYLGDGSGSCPKRGSSQNQYNSSFRQMPTDRGWRSGAPL